MMQELWGCSLDGRAHLACKRYGDIPHFQKKLFVINILLLFNLENLGFYDARIVGM